MWGARHSEYKAKIHPSPLNYIAWGQARSTRHVFGKQIALRELRHQLIENGNFFFWKRSSAPGKVIFFTGSKFTTYKDNFECSQFSFYYTIQLNTQGYMTFMTMKNDCNHFPFILENYYTVEPWYEHYIRAASKDVFIAQLYLAIYCQQSR